MVAYAQEHADLRYGALRFVYTGKERELGEKISMVGLLSQ